MFHQGMSHGFEARPETLFPISLVGAPEGNTAQRSRNFGWVGRSYGGRRFAAVIGSPVTEVCQ